MVLDAFNAYSLNQALAASGVSTNIIDHRAGSLTALGGKRDLGIGTALAVLFVVTAALTGTNFQAAIQTATDAAFTVPITLIQSPVFLPANLPVNSKFVLNVPPDKNALAFTRINYTLTAATITLSAFLLPLNFIQNEDVLPQLIVIN